MSRIGNVGKFMSMDLIDRVSTIGSTLSSNLDKMTEEEKKKYKQFLENELRKLDQMNKKALVVRAVAAKPSNNKTQLKTKEDNKLRIINDPIQCTVSQA